MNDEGLADVEAANSFRLPTLTQEFVPHRPRSRTRSSGWRQNVV